MHPDVAEFLQCLIGCKKGLLLATRNGTPHLPNNIERRWLTARLKKMGLDEPGMGWHAFRRFRKTWLRGERCQEDINNFWMGHKPKTMSELYSHLFEETDLRLAEEPKPLDLVSISPRRRLLHRLHRDFEAEVFREMALTKPLMIK